MSQSCGTCKHFEVENGYDGDYGDCEYPMPEKQPDSWDSLGIDNLMLVSEGTKCPCYDKIT